jgi:hypothetical protein
MLEIRRFEGGRNMATMPKKVEERLIEGLKRFQPILTAAKARDVNEADTVVIVTDLLADVFGYDKYTEITREFAIRGTLCDLALKLDDKLELLDRAAAEVGNGGRCGGGEGVTTKTRYGFATRFRNQ